MTDIGQTLREARMRAKIDITDVEMATKIRAKYLRALENEEWNLLPGPTFVKSFLRTYAQYLGLDARLIVEEYKRNFERPADSEAPPFGAPLARDREGRSRPPKPSPIFNPRVLAVVGVIAVIVALLFILGKWGSGGGGGNNGTQAKTTTSTTSHRATTKHHATKKKKAAPTLATLRLRAKGSVYVCLIDDKGAKRIAGQTLAAGTRTPTYHARHFLMTVGNSQITMRVNGKALTVPPSTGATNYLVTPTGRHTRPAGKGANCG